MRTHELYVKKFLLPYLKDGSKGLEIRPKSPFINTIQVGDIISFNRQINRKVVAIREYRTIEEAAQHENAEQICPGWKMGALIKAFHTLYPPNALAKGIKVFALAPV